MRALLALLLVFFVGYGGELKIVQMVPFGKSNLRISFDKKITLEKIKEKKLKDGRSILDVSAVLKPKAKKYSFSNKSSIKVAQNTNKIVRIVIDSGRDNGYSLRFVDNFLYIDIASKKSLNPDIGELFGAREQKSTTKNTIKRSIKRIVVDPGHGGKDCGAIGVADICEKTIVLSTAQFLAQELKKRGYIVYLTRNRDVYLDLIRRTKFANSKNADLFISIHANSVPKKSKKSANGVETYFLSTARSARAKRVAELENKDTVENMNFFSKQTFLNYINSHRLVASNKLALDIQFGILNSLDKKYKNVLDGGVREGPFWVLAGALMPSVLIEIGYVSHNLEGRRINNKAYQASVAQGIADGVDGYFAKN